MEKAHAIENKTKQNKTKKKESKMAYMNWNQNLSVGVNEIDSQHKQLIQMVNDFYSGINDNDEKALGKLLTSLVEYAVYHFQTEEKYMDKFNYADTANHKKEHRLFVEKASDVKKRFVDGQLVLSVEITNFVKEWIVKHVMGSDKKYSNCFVENGLN
jgi:hemerythrin-like metal-binding protein